MDQPVRRDKGRLRERQSARLLRATNIMWEYKTTLFRKWTHNIIQVAFSWTVPGDESTRLDPVAREVGRTTRPGTWIACEDRSLLSVGFYIHIFKIKVSYLVK